MVLSTIHHKEKLFGTQNVIFWKKSGTKIQNKIFWGIKNQRNCLERLKLKFDIFRASTTNLISRLTRINRPLDHKKLMYVCRKNKKKNQSFVANWPFG